MTKILIIAATLVLAGCATPEPAIEIRTVTVPIQVPVTCVDKKDIPAEPEQVKNRLIGEAQTDLNTVSSSALLLRAWGRELTAMLNGCAYVEQSRVRKP